MDQSEIRERIERAHRKAAYELKDYLEEFMTEEPDFSRSKEYYCKCFISELYVNSAGVKDYDRDDLSDLMPCALSEFEKLNEHVNDVILAYKQSRLNRKIILCQHWLFWLADSHKRTLASTTSTPMTRQGLSSPLKMISQYGLRNLH